jgi:uncharacterized protein
LQTPFVSFVTLITLDLNREIDFLRGSFGFDSEKQHTTGFVSFLLNGFRLALCEPGVLQIENEKVKSQQTIVSLNVGSLMELDERFHLALMNGGTSRCPPAKTTWGGHQAFVWSPNGHLWEICFNPNLIG